MGLALAGVVAMSIIGTAGAASAGTGKAKVWVAHGIRGAVVDVCVNKGEVKSNFEFKDKFSAKLPAGSYSVSIRAASKGECKGDIILWKRLDLQAGKNYTAIAGMTRKGGVRLYAFGNNVKPLADSTARLTVRHTAAAPKVDVWVNGSPAITDFAPNGTEATVTLARGDYTVRVAPANTTTTVIGARTFDLMGGMAHQVFAVGDGDAGYAFLVIGQPAAAG
jgi:hypothetical protein